MATDTSSLSAIIKDFSELTAKDSVSPASLAAIFDRIVELLARTADPEDLETLTVLSSDIAKIKLCGSVIKDLSLTLDGSTLNLRKSLINLSSALGSSTSTPILGPATSDSPGLMTPDHIRAIEEISNSPAAPLADFSFNAGPEDLRQGFTTINESTDFRQIKYGISAHDSYFRLWIPVLPGDIYALTTVGGGNAKAWAWFAGSGQIISCSAQNLKCEDLELVAPDDAAFLVVHSTLAAYDNFSLKLLNGSLTRFLTLKIRDAIAGISEAIDFQSRVTAGIGYAVTKESLLLGYVEANSETAVATDLFTKVRNSDLYWRFWMEVKPGQRFYLTTYGAFGAKAWAWYDADGKIISWAPSEFDYKMTTDHGLIAPDNAAILLVHCSKSYLDSFRLCVGGFPLAQYVDDRIKIFQTTNPGNSQSGSREPDDNESSDAQKEIKILFYGNSFTCDSVSYVPTLLSMIAPDLKFTLAIAYIPGCSLAQHAANFSQKVQTLDGAEYSPTTYELYVSTSDAPKWGKTGDLSALRIFDREEWDLVTFQQNGIAAPKAFDTYFKPYLSIIISNLYSLSISRDRRLKLGWLLTQGAYGQTDAAQRSQWQGTAANAGKVMESTPFEVLFPFGTAVENLRATDLKDLADGIGLTVDGGHLQEGLGCLTAAYANTITILDLAGLGHLSVFGTDFEPDREICDYIGVVGPNYGTSGVVGISMDNCLKAQTAAICAVKNPYEVSAII
ncbi:MAG: DUF4886 domain-containing protein [Bacteroides sp.]|nr:DUF4886 domain-containing protein [Bacteroides sp.]